MSDARSSRTSVETPSTIGRIEAAVAALPPGPLSEAAVGAHIAPLFSRVREAQRELIYLANHSLGRPLDATADDVREAIALWYTRMNRAWDEWKAEIAAFRARIGALVGAPRADCVIPRVSAGAGLRAVLNALPGTPRVVTTREEFDSLDLILREYARRGRIELSFVEPRDDGDFTGDDVLAALARPCDLLVVSQTMFRTGQILPALPRIVAAAHAAGARVLLDVYHSLGVFPVDVAALDVDFAVGGSYKYLRGGPGACFLFVAPRELDAGLATLDVGWFAKESPFDYARPDPPRYGPGGDAWLESTPAVVPFFQARAGQVFLHAIGVARLREQSLRLQRRLAVLLAERGFAAIGGSEDRGAFVVVRDPRARRWSDALAARGIVTDARGDRLRLCPDVLTTEAELRSAAAALAEVARAATAPPR